MNKIVLSEKYSIWTRKYTGGFKKEEFLKYVDLNNKLSAHTNSNSVWMEIVTPCFTEVNDMVKQIMETIDGRFIDHYAEHYWVYTQTKGFDLEWMHQHLLVHPQGRSKILTDYTFTYYIQTPTDIEGDEGHIVFEDENKKRHKFLPKEGDIFVFPADIRHTAIPTPNSEVDRIVYAGSICMDIHNQNNDSKSTI